MNNPLPILYTFRRCPYAIRARCALAYAGITVQSREILLKNKHLSLLAASEKGTVPVLILTDGGVIDESIEIIHWAIKQQDKDNWYIELSDDEKQSIDELINTCDHNFKKHLDHYKYADRNTEFTQCHYRQQCEVFLQQLEYLLQQQTYLSSNTITLADMAIFPFIRQFASVDKCWFEQSEYINVRQWLNHFLQLPLFLSTMEKKSLWKDGN